jgi:hypothetical protein
VLLVGSNNQLEAAADRAEVQHRGSETAGSEVPRLQVLLCTGGPEAWGMPLPLGAEVEACHGVNGMG